MSQTLAIWKWRPGWPFRFETRVMKSLAEDQAPSAIIRFDAHALADTIRNRFGDGDDAPFNLEVCDFTGHSANWLIVSVGGSTPCETLDALVRLCEDRGLHIFAW